MNGELHGIEHRLRSALAEPTPPIGWAAMDARMAGLVTGRPRARPVTREATGHRQRWMRPAALGVVATATLAGIVLALPAVLPGPGPSPSFAGIGASPAASANPVPATPAQSAVPSSTPPAAGPATSPGSSAGCVPATAAEIDALGIADEPLHFGPMRRTRLVTRWSVVPTEAQVEDAGLVVVLPELPGGLLVRRMDTNGAQPISLMHEVRFLLAPEPLEPDETYPGLLDAGGAILTVRQRSSELDVASRLLAEARKYGTETRMGIIRVGSSDAAIARGDERGTVRPNTISWSDATHEYHLETTFQDSVALVDLARAIGCAQAP